MSDNEDVILAFQFHYNRLQSYNDVAIRLAATISIVEFVFITISKIVRVCLLYRQLINW